jgi:type I restriction enzyme S subunit
VPSARFAELVGCVADTCHPSNADTEVYVGLEHIDSGAFQLNRFGHPDNVTSAKTRFRSGDILYGKLRPYLDKAVLADREGICSTDILVFRPKPGVVATYALGLIHSDAFRDNATATTQGVNHPRTSWNGVSSFECFAPPKPEQQKIAAVLWKMQRAIATQDRLIAATRELKQSAMQRLFTYGLRGEPLKDTAIGAMPESWQPTSIGGTATVGSGGTPARANPEYWLDGTIPWVKTGEVDYCVIKHTEESITPEGLRNSAAKIFPKGTLLVAMYGQGITRGKVAVLGVDASINQACAAIQARDDGVRTDFLYYVLSHGYERLRGLAHGGQQQNLNADLIRGFLFGLPAEPHEQRDIAAALATIDRKLAHHQHKRAALNDLFQTALHQLMTAQIRVADLDIDTAEVAA